MIPLDMVDPWTRVLPAKASRRQPAPALAVELQLPARLVMGRLTPKGASLRSRASLTERLPPAALGETVQPQLRNASGLSVSASVDDPARAAGTSRKARTGRSQRKCPLLGVPAPTATLLVDAAARMPVSCLHRLVHRPPGGLARPGETTPSLWRHACGRPMTRIIASQNIPISVVMNFVNKLVCMFLGLVPFEVIVLYSIVVTLGARALSVAVTPRRYRLPTDPTRMGRAWLASRANLRRGLHHGGYRYINRTLRT